MVYASGLAADDAPFVARALGVELAWWRAAGHGQGRTVLAETVGGEPVVVKWFPGRQEPLAVTVRACEVLRGRGYPAPRTLAFGPAAPHGQGWIQERLPGEPCLEGLDGSLLDQVMEAVELQADAGEPAAEAWSYVAAVVFDDKEGWWQAARARGPDAAALCDRLVRWVRQSPRARPRRDFVHLDLNFTNILAKEGRLTGIVDLDHLGSDDRSVDLVTLIFNYEEDRRDTGQEPPTDALERLRRAVLRISGEAGWRQAVTFRAIADLAWTGLQGDRLPLERTLAVAKAVVPELPRLPCGDR
jgi:hypothetical protein